MKEFDFSKELSPLKKALIVAIIGDHPEQAKEPHMRELIHEVLMSTAVQKMERSITRDPMVYKNVADFGRELSASAKPDLKMISNGLLDAYKKFEALQGKIEDHRSQWAKTVQARNLSEPKPETGLGNVIRTETSPAAS